MKTNELVSRFVCISWCGIGFIRGINSYGYNYKKYNKDAQYLYLHSFLYGLAGLGLYCNPILLPFSVCKEIYRLEVNIRNLENEKETNNYKNLWF